MAGEAADLKGGLVGCGYFSRNHLHGWAGHVKGAGIHCLCDTDPDKLKACAEEFGIPAERCYASVAAMLDAEELDFCDVVTLPNTHKPIVLEICAHARRPKHVICQKPLAPSLEDARAMVDGCREAGVKLIVHENFRFQPAMRALQRAVAEADIGNIFWGRVSFRSYADVFTNQPYLATDKRWIIYDLGVHSLDVARFFMGDARDVYCKKQRVDAAIAGEDVATMLVGMASGATCLVDVSYATRHEEDLFPQTLIELEAERGSARLGKDFSVTVVRRDGHDTATAKVTTATAAPKHEPWMTESGRLIQSSIGPAQQHFADCMRFGAEAETSGEDNIKTLALVMAAYDSADSGAPVRV